MCGGSYEDGEPQVLWTKYSKFESTTGFGRAAAICELENIRLQIRYTQNTIHFKNVEAEENFSASLMVKKP